METQTTDPIARLARGLTCLPSHGGFTTLGEAYEAADAFLDLVEADTFTFADREDEAADLLAALYWHAAEWHGGQWSEGYALLSRAGAIFTPGPYADGPEADSMEAEYHEALHTLAEEKTA